MRQISKIAVLGGGLMGSGIANVYAMGGYKVVIREVSPELAEKSIAGIKQLLNERLSRGRITQELFDKTLGNLSTAVDLAEAVGDADVIIEAVPEEVGMKQKAIAEVEAVARPDAIFCTNTSAISITSIASGAKRKQNVIGTHFFFPAPVMRLVEISRTASNPQDLVDDIVALCKSVGKFPVVINDSPGFVSARALGHLKEAITIWSQGPAEAAAIDKIDRAFGHPMGPLEMMDSSGVETFLHVFDYEYDEFGREDMKAPLALRTMVRRGDLGRRAGKGFYDYSQKPEAATAADDAGAVNMKRISLLTDNPDGPFAALLARCADSVVVSNGAELENIAGDCDLIVEDLSDDPGKKASVLQEIERTVSESAIIATVTHCVAVAEISKDCARKDRIIGLNFLGGPPEKPTVEVPFTGNTAENAKGAVAAVLRKAGADPVLVRDMPGLVSARIELPLLREAIIMVQDHVADAQAIEDIYVHGFNNPRGPLAAADDMGLDHLVWGFDYLYNAYKTPQFIAPGLLRQMVAEGRLGKKSGEGFLKY